MEREKKVCDQSIYLFFTVGIPLSMIQNVLFFFFFQLLSVIYWLCLFTLLLQRLTATKYCLLGIILIFNYNIFI